MTTPILPNERSTRSLSEFEFNQDSNSKDSKLGKGSFANVQLAKEKISGNLIAMKIINANLTTASKSDIHNLQTEIKIHRELNHPNIIKFQDYIQEGSNVYLALEYAPNGNLYSYITKKKNLSQSQIFRFFYQSCLAIQYLHQRDILHRDLKPENLLLDKDLNIKLCDFGWAARSIRDRRTTFCGTYEYMAPEIVEKKTYDYRVDIWSLGVLLYELVHGEAPYKGRSLSEITASFAKGPFQIKSSVASDLRDLIQKILQANPEDRISLNEMLSHSWVQKNLEQSSAGNTSRNLGHARSADNVRSLGKTQTSRGHGEGDAQYNAVMDKENLQGKVVVHQYRELENQAQQDEIARALANFNYAAEHFPESRKRAERPELLPGLLMTKENFQGTSYGNMGKGLNYNRSVEREFQARRQVDYPGMVMMRTVSDRGGMTEGLDIFNDYNKRPKLLDRSMTNSNLKLHQSEMDPNIASQNTTFDKGESPANVSVMKGYNNQKARDLLKKAESTRTYYFRSNYFEKNQQHPSQYSSNLIIQHPQVDNRVNYSSVVKYPVALRPHQTNYDPRAVHNDYEDNTQWKNSNVALKTETYRVGTQRMPHYESLTPTAQLDNSVKMVRPGITTLRSLPVISYSKSQIENDPKMSLFPYYNQNMTSVGWHQGHGSVHLMGATLSGPSSPLVLNERFQSSGK